MKTLHEQYSPEEQLKKTGFGKELDKSKKPFSQIRILDIGCGEKARLYWFLKPKGYEIFGIDPLIWHPSQSLIQREVGQGSPLPFENNYFDYIVTHGNPLLQEGLAINLETRKKQLLEIALQNTKYRDAETLRRINQDISRKLGNSEQDSIFILIEALRTLKPRGKLFVYPGLIRINEVLGENWYEGRSQPKIETIPIKTSLKDKSNLNYRTIITK